MARDWRATSILVTAFLIFITFIPLGILSEVHGFIPDAFIFMGLSLFYYFTYNFWGLNPPMFTLLIIAHILHMGGTFGWYHISPLPIQWDHITHFFGSIPFTLLFFSYFRKAWDKRFFTGANFIRLIIIFFAAMGVGQLVEASEFWGYLSFGFGDGTFMFGPGDGVAGKEGAELIDALGGGWINEGWDITYNFLGTVAGMLIMIACQWLIPAIKPQSSHRKPSRARKP